MGAPFLARVFAREVGILILTLNEKINFKLKSHKSLVIPTSRVSDAGGICYPVLLPKSQRNLNRRTQPESPAPPWKSAASAPPQGIEKGALAPVSILRNLPIYHRRHILPRPQIPKLHHPMPFPRQLSPPARLLRILLNPLILHSIHHKPHRPKLPRSSPRDSRHLPPNADLQRCHHLLRHRFQNLPIHHVFTRKSDPLWVPHFCRAVCGRSGDFDFELKSQDPCHSDQSRSDERGIRCPTLSPNVNAIRIASTTIKESASAP